MEHCSSGRRLGMGGIMRPVQNWPPLGLAREGTGEEEVRIVAECGTSRA